MSFPDPDPAAEPPTSWVLRSLGERPHWTESGRALCGVPVPPTALVLSPHALPLPTRRDHPQWKHPCQRCLDAVIIREFELPFRAGDYVQSRAEGMVLRGQIANFFLASDGLPMLNITRIWPRKPEPITIRHSRIGNWNAVDTIDNDIYPHDWYRYPHECRPWDGPPKKAKTSPARPKKKKAPLLHADPPLPPDEVERRLRAIGQGLRRSP